MSGELPFVKPLTASWCDPSTLVGVLPERMEPVASWRSSPEHQLPEGGVRPAVVALFDAVTEQDINLRWVEIRQTVVGTDADQFTVEISVTKENLLSLVQNLRSLALVCA